MEIKLRLFGLFSVIFAILGFVYFNSLIDQKGNKLNSVGKSIIYSLIGGIIVSAIFVYGGPELIFLLAFS